MSTNTVVTVPSWAQAFVAQYALTAYNLWQSNAIQPYGGAIVASQAQNEADGIAALAARARSGDLVISKATSFLDGVINGDRLLGTKADFLAMLALVTGNSTTDFASVNSRIGKKARFIGDPDAAFLAQSLVSGVPTLYNNRMSAALYSDNFTKERVLQDHAMSYGVEMGKHPVIDAEMLRNAGLAVRDYLQNSYVLNHKLFLETEEFHVANLEIFGNMLRALTGSQQTTISDDAKNNKVAAAVGMGTTGAVAGYMIGAEIGSVGGPWGAAIGFVVGGLVGWFSS